MNKCGLIDERHVTVTQADIRPTARHVRKAFLDHPAPAKPAQVRINPQQTHSNVRNVCYLKTLPLREEGLLHSKSWPIHQGFDFLLETPLPRPPLSIHNVYLNVSSSILPQASSNSSHWLTPISGKVCCSFQSWESLILSWLAFITGSCHRGFLKKLLIIHIIQTPICFITEA